MPRDLLRLELADGTSVEDRLRAFADALVSHGQRGIFLLIDVQTNQFEIAGHIPDDKEKLKRILEELVDKLNRDSKDPLGMHSAPFSRVI